ncbi:hypothetical protein BV22DRAFT_1135688 [Leucogyrophana mollusca]|uniref:Uncharacterized protein n=1 Tax=Leucogyrophana mollusca TaxID=85980 RepID=A0ACB8AX11_9AGAM|nr:hypothetical protein BV22DRAFT_1135688 [Leucogyrophana mollusca]
MSPAQAAFANAVAAQAFAVPNGGADHSALLANSRAQSIGMASGFAEVMLLVASDFRELLRTPLRDLVDLCTKQLGVRSSLLKLQKHKAQGTYPPQLLGIHMPQWPLTKEYSEAHPDAQSEIKTKWEAYRTDNLNAAILLKTQELAFLDQILVPQTYLPQLSDIVNTAFNQLKGHYQQQIMANDGTDVLRWDTSPAFKKIRDDLLVDLPHIGHRLLAIVRTGDMIAKQKEEAKKKLKDTADVEMGDASTSDAKIADLVNRSVSDALKKLRLNDKGSAKTPKVKKAKEKMLQTPWGKKPAKGFISGTAPNKSKKPVQKRGESSTKKPDASGKGKQRQK